MAKYSSYNKGLLHLQILLKFVNIRIICNVYHTKTKKITKMISLNAYLVLKKFYTDIKLLKH